MYAIVLTTVLNSEIAWCFMELIELPSPPSPIDRESETCSKSRLKVDKRIFRLEPTTGNNSAAKA